MSEVPLTAFGGERSTATAPATASVFLDERPRCTGTFRGRTCGKLLAEYVSRPWSIRCKCGAVNEREAPS